MESSCGERGGFGGFGGCGGERCLAARCANFARAGVRPGGGWGSAAAATCSVRSPPRGASGAASTTAGGLLIMQSLLEPGTRLTALGSTNAQRWRPENLVLHWHSYFQANLKSYVAR